MYFLLTYGLNPGFLTSDKSGRLPKQQEKSGSEGCACRRRISLQPERREPEKRGGSRASGSGVIRSFTWTAVPYCVSYFTVRSAVRGLSSLRSTVRHNFLANYALVRHYGTTILQPDCIPYNPGPARLQGEGLDPGLGPGCMALGRPKKPTRLYMSCFRVIMHMFCEESLGKACLFLAGRLQQNSGCKTIHTRFA